MSWASRISKGIAIAGVLAVAAVAWAGSSGSVPGPYPIKKGERSPGQVTFNHSTHMKAETARCADCHPALWKESVPEEPMTHKRFRKGEQCGACHDGNKAFGMKECAKCHEKKG
jgi:c(7)-type cytochrome triheme protein